MNPIVDTHCHLDLDAFDNDRCETIERALGVDVRAMVLIGYSPERWTSTSTMCSRYPFMLRAVGIHPNEAARWNDDIESALVSEIEQTRPIAVGEIGLDFYRSDDHADAQREAFVRQLELARKYELPVVIHQRSAETETIEAIEQHAPVSGVMHCFTGDVDYALRCVNAGMHLGIGGVLTFPKSGGLRTAVAEVPVERLVLETDAPFLAPQSRRGKRNEPAYLVEIVECLAMALELSTEEAVEQTTRNALALFGDALEDALGAGMETC